MNKPVLTLFAKILLFLAPFALVLAITLVRTPSPEELQQRVLNEKIEKLVVSAPEAPQVLIAGDSRAKRQAIPALFTEGTGLTSVNIAVDGGSPATFYETLSRYGELNKHRLIVMSVSFTHINDGSIGFEEIDREAIHEETWGIQKAQDLFLYYKGLTDYYLSHYKNLLRPDIRDINFLDAQAFGEKGYVANSETLVVPLREGINDHNPWYDSIRVGGVKEGAFRDVLERYGSLNDVVVFYLPPISPAWRESFGATEKGGKIKKAEDYFAALMREEVSKHPNMYLLDWYTNDTTGIGNEGYNDVVHLNDRGAHLFTPVLVNELRKRGLVR